MPDTVALLPGAELPSTNVAELTVSELSGALKRTVEDRFGYVRVRGEVSNYRGPHSSGHAYFCLKDEAARIDAVVWRTAFARMRIKPEEGMEVVATGKITTYPGKSSYQIIIESLEPAGLGALMAMLEQRRRKLAAEGLFDTARKRALPYLPHSIGVVTSPTGAVIRDILHRIAGRFPRRVMLWPVRVQGETSAAEIALAIRGFNALAANGALAPPHVLIVARGGGSLEDLWGFNDEALVRAAAESAIPLVSAVGHETDWTLLDHVADLRAPTPTGAAELCVPVRAELLATLDRLSARHTSGALRLLENRRDALRATARALLAGSDLLALPRQRLDRAGSRLPSGLRLCADRRRLALVRTAGRLAVQSPHARLARAAQRVEDLGKRLRGGFAFRLTLAAQQVRSERDRVGDLARRLDRAGRSGNERRLARVDVLGQLLGTLGYRSVLARGFALVRDGTGEPVRSAGQAPDGTALSIELADGVIAAQVVQGGASRGEAEVRPRTRPRPRTPTPVRQGSLF